MPQVSFTAAAVQDLQRLREFLRQTNPDAGLAIRKTVQALGLRPQMGRPADDMAPEFRELLIDFGDSGYVALYRLDVTNIVTVLAIRHQKEAGF
jgi:plasmid stabilization system protein ParE